MALSALDAERLAAALSRAMEAIGTSDPNPRVGCIIGRSDGTLLGSGSTQQAGAAHAEVMALRAAQAAGLDVRGATAWVTLEPCAHHGRTPPCCDALVAAGVARVVIAVQDPFPGVAGRGIERRRAAGVEVELADGAIAHAARELNIGFFSRQERGLPWVRLKVAASLDGRTALENGASQWITGAPARADGHAWRRRAGAVLTGIGTVLADDPRLDVRLVPTTLQPLRVVLDSQLRLPASARILQSPGRVLVVTACADEAPAEPLLRQGAEVLRLPDAQGRVDLQALLVELGKREINELHVEAGALLNASLLHQRHVDELLIYLAPTLLGPGRGWVDWPAFEALAQASPWRFDESVQLGNDLRLRARRLPDTVAEPYVDEIYTN